MQFTKNLGFIGKKARERRAERRELKQQRKARKLSATTKAERRDIRQQRKNDRVANRHEFRMSDNFRAAAQARSQIFANAIQAGGGLIASFTGRGGGGGVAPFNDFNTQTSPTNNDFKPPPQPQQRGLFGEKPLIQGVPDLALIGGAAVLFIMLKKDK